MMESHKGVKRSNYDEYQLFVRYKYGYYGIFLMIGLMLINQFIVAQHVWASTIIQTLVIIYIVATYLITMYVFKNAYISQNERSPFVVIGSIGVLGFANLAYTILWRPNLPLYQNNYLQDNAAPLLSGIFFLYVSLILLVQYIINQKKEER